MSLPWDVFATPIAARKLARLGVEHDEVVLRPAFYRQLGASYGTVAARHVPARRPRGAGGGVQLRLLRGRRRHPALAPRRRRTRARGARRRARGSRDRARPRLPRERPARDVGAVPRRVRALRATGRGVRPAPLRRSRPRVPPLRPAHGRAQLGLRGARRAGHLHHRRSCAGPARHPSGVRPRADHRARRDPAPHRCARARHRIGHPARLRPARDRRVAGHRAVAARSPRRAPRPRRHRSGAVATSLESGGRRGRDRV